MEIIQFTSSDSFNAIFSIYMNLTILIAPLLVAISFLRN